MPLNAHPLISRENMPGLKGLCFGFLPPAGKISEPLEILVMMRSRVSVIKHCANES